MLIPDNGFEQPCCADCAEHNARGCPGVSPFCVQDKYAALDHQIRKLQEGIDQVFLDVARILPGSARGHDLESAAYRDQEAAVAALERIRSVVDEANSLNRHLRVSPQEDAA